MRFTVPQFIEHEARIFGPFTFKQFIYVGLAGAACFILYFSLPFSLFLLAAMVLLGGAAALGFLKIGGRGLPTIISNVLKFGLAPKMYVWKKKEDVVTVYQKKQPSFTKATKNKEEDQLPLKIAEKSQLKKLSTQIETKSR